MLALDWSPQAVRKQALGAALATRLAQQHAAEGVGGAGL